jgi:hypothetical protein
MDKNQTGIGNVDWVEEIKSTKPEEPRKAWKFGKWEENNEDGNANP